MSEIVKVYHIEEIMKIGIKNSSFIVTFLMPTPFCWLTVLK